MSVPTISTAILDSARLLLAEGSVYELRILNTSKKTVSGYFNDFSKLAEEAAAWDGKAPGIYFTLNPVNLDLLARSVNRLKEWARLTTSDTDIVQRRWLPIDCDPVRPSGISATAAEHEEAIDRVETIGSWLRQQGWPLPVLADSGNGGHLLYRIDLPNDRDSTALVQRCLEALDLHFSDGAVTVDVTNYNAARIWKLYGTKTAKGDSTEERPHRVSSVLYTPPDLEPVAVTLLKKLAGSVPRRGTKVGVGGGAFDLDAWIRDHDLSVARSGPWVNGSKWILNPCPWKGDHTDDSAYIVQFNSGAIAAGCHHNGCAGKGWRDLRELLEPGRLGVAFSDNGAGPDADAPTFPRTDAGNGEQFSHLYGGSLRYDHRRKRWLVWAGHWWRPDSNAEVRRLAKDATRLRYQAATGIEDLKERELEAKWAIASESRMRMDATLIQAASEHPVTDAGDRWDLDSWLLGVDNGVVDLRTGELRDGRPDDRITMHSAAPYDLDAPCSRWEAFVTEVFADDELADYIWRACGYSLTGITSEQCLFICYGSGWNGKSTFKRVQENVLGDYAANTPFSTLEIAGRYSISNDVAALQGKRLVTAGEINEGRRLNEARLKALAGEDTMTARFLYSEHFTFRPVAKFWLSVNHKPIVGDDSAGFWRKIRLVPFTQSFKGRADPNLETNLKAECPGILAWMVRGCLEWQRRGLEPPDSVKAATETYREESDPLAAFIAEACVLNPDAATKASNLFKRYKNWAEDAGLSDRERLSSTKFGAAMGERCAKRHTRDGWFYDGIAARIDGLNEGS